MAKNQKVFFTSCGPITLQESRKDLRPSIPKSFAHQGNSFDLASGHLGENDNSSRNNQVTNMELVIVNFPI